MIGEKVAERVDILSVMKKSGHILGSVEEQQHSSRANFSNNAEVVITSASDVVEKVRLACEEYRLDMPPEFRTS